MDQIDKAYVLQSEETIAHLSAKVKLQEQRIQEFLKDGGRYAEEMAKLRQSVKALDPYPKYRYVAGDETRSAVSPVVMWSDWQIGEKIDVAETLGWGSFDFAAAERRVFQYDESFLGWVSMHRRAGYPIHDLHIFSIGDIVSGNIHYELEVTNEFPVMVATAKAAHLFAEAIRRLAPHFRTVTVWAVTADNHGRITKKNQWKQGAKNNYSYLAHEIAKSELKDHSNVKWEISEGVMQRANVQGKIFLLKHGHQIKSVQGIPYYGIQREKGREAVRHIAEKQTFDYIAMGHFHTEGIVERNVLMNGNLPGTTELDNAVGRHGPPAQNSFMVHPKHGVFNFTSWRLK